MSINRIVLIDDCETDNIFHEMVLATADFEGDLKIFDSPSAGRLAQVARPAGGDVDLIFCSRRFWSSKGHFRGFWLHDQTAGP
jgi:hypothetical protein